MAERDIAAFAILCRGREYVGVRLIISLTSLYLAGDFTILSIDFLYWRPPAEAARFLDFPFRGCSIATGDWSPCEIRLLAATPP